MIRLTIILLLISQAIYCQFGLLFVNFNPTDEIPTDSLRAYYPFNGNANDESGKGNDGSVNGATLTTDRNGAPNSAYDFDGNDWIDIGNGLDFAGTNKFAVSIWIYYTGNDGQIIGRDNVTSRQWALIISGGRATIFAVNDPSGNVLCQSSVLSSPAWYHIVGQFESGTPVVYVDNVLDCAVQSGTLSSFKAAAINNDIGRRPNATFYYTGKIDQIRVYDKELTTNEISALYNEK